MSNSPATPRLDSAAPLPTNIARDEIIAQCVEIVRSLLPAHDAHICCQRERLRLVSALEALRLTDTASRITHGKA